MAEVFGGVYQLPFFMPVDGVDAGFYPIDHTHVDSRFRTWEGVRTLSGAVEIVADLIVNRVSSPSPQFLDFSKNGSDSLYAGMFLTLYRVFSQGACESDILSLYRLRPTLHFAPVTLLSGERKMLRITFNPKQVDIDIRNPQSEAYLDSIIRKFQASGIKVI
jgi:sucrose phosphorylase